MRPLSRTLLTDIARRPGAPVIGPTAAMPERVLQFGEGSFLRGFADWMFDELNRRGLFLGQVVVVQPRARGLGLLGALNAQDGLYTLLLRGLKDGQICDQRQIITCVSRGLDPYRQWDEFLQTAANPDLRFIVSNTTEAGICQVAENPPQVCPESFPAKVAAFLWQRARAFHCAPDKGMVLLPCELIERNGARLKEIVLGHLRVWRAEADVVAWAEEHNHFLNTLVDRIVSGYPEAEAAQLAAQLGYTDKLLDVGEIFHLLVIEDGRRFQAELPFDRAGLNVVWTDDLAPYRTRKIRLLNGAHTLLAPVAYLYGVDTIGASVADPVLEAYLKQGLLQEILPTLDVSPREENQAFARAVLERFRNPFIAHKLLNIALNSVSKYKLRVLPSLLAGAAQDRKWPRVLAFSLAGLIAFYRGSEIRDGALQGVRAGRPYAIQDERAVLEFFAAQWQAFAAHADVSRLTAAVLSRADFWGQDLAAVPGLEREVANHLSAILARGMRTAVQTLVS